MIESDAHRPLGTKDAFAGSESLEGRSDVVITSVLATRQRTRIAAQIGEMWREATEEAQVQFTP